MEELELKRSIEALLLICDKPLTLQQIQEATAEEPSRIRRELEALKLEAEEAGRGFRLKALAGGYQWVTDPALSIVVKKFVQIRDKRRISQASLETLSIIAYRQPMTRQEIEMIRGVNVDGAIRTLLEKGLIRITGRKDAPGRPILHATTQAFLDHFGLASLKELPRLAEFTERDIELPDTLKAKTAEAKPEAVKRGE